MKKTTHDSRINRYLNEEMNSEEMDVFETDLKQDVDLKKAFHLEVTTRYTIHHLAKGENLLLSEEESEEQSTFPQEYEQEELVDDSSENIRDLTKKLRKRQLIIGLLVAASIALLFLFIFDIDPQNDTSSQYKRIAEDFYTAPPTPGTLGSAEQYAVAFQVYNQEDFEEAIVQFQAFLQEDPQNEMLNYFLAHSYVRSQPPQPAKAIQIFSTIEYEFYKENAEWNLAIAYLFNEQLEQAIEIATTIKDKAAHNFNQKASSLLEKLSNYEKGNH